MSFFPRSVSSSESLPAPAGSGRTGEGAGFAKERERGGEAGGQEMEPWRRCYREVGAKLLLYARQILQSDHVVVGQGAEDVVQLAFLRFWRQYPQAQPEQYGLLFAAVRTEALNVLRSSLRRSQREDLYSVDMLNFRDSAALQQSWQSWFEAGEEDGARAERVQSALGKIPAEQREVIVMKVWGELTFAQIAEALKESANTVASRYRLGMNALKRVLHAGGQDGI